MATGSECCPRCGVEGRVEFGDTYFGTELVWWASRCCTACSFAMEEDGHGPLPEEMRALVMEQEGVWMVQVPVEMQRKPLVLRAVREAFGLTISELGTLLSGSDAWPAAGTRAEMERFQAILARAGVKGDVVRRFADDLTD